MPASDSPLRAKELASSLDISLRAATGLLNQLAEGGAIASPPRGRGPREAHDAEAADAAEEASERRERIEESRVEVMRRYAETRDCRRRLLLGYFGEDLPQPCGRCDRCRAGAAQEETLDESLVPYPTGAAVDHVEWGRGSVVDVESDRVTVFFEDRGYKVLALQAVEENELLRRVS